MFHGAGNSSATFLQSPRRPLESFDDIRFSLAILVEWVREVLSCVGPLVTLIGHSSQCVVIRAYRAERSAVSPRPRDHRYWEWLFCILLKAIGDRFVPLNHPQIGFGGEALIRKACGV